MPQGIYKHHPHQGYQKGHKPSLETLEKLRISHLGKVSFKKPEVRNICPVCGTSFKVYPSQQLTIKYCKKECRRIGQSRRPPWNKGLKGFRAGEKRPGIMPKGENSSSWKGGPAFWKKRHTKNDWGLRGWAILVRTRDNNTCQFKNEHCRGQLEVHHILPWRDYPEERYNVNNGIVLCFYHHPRKRATEKELEPILQELVKSKSYSDF